MQGGGRKRPPAKTGVQSKPFVIFEGRALPTFAPAVRDRHRAPGFAVPFARAQYSPVQRTTERHGKGPLAKESGDRDRTPTFRHAAAGNDGACTCGECVPKPPKKKKSAAKSAKGSRRSTRSEAVRLSGAGAMSVDRDADQQQIDVRLGHAAGHRAVRRRKGAQEAAERVENWARGGRPRRAAREFPPQGRRVRKVPGVRRVCEGQRRRA